MEKSGDHKYQKYKNKVSEKNMGTTNIKNVKIKLVEYMR